MDRSAAEVYEELAPAVLGYLRSKGARDAEDLTGDVFVKVAEGLASFSGDPAALRRWVFTIAHNRLVDGYRREGRRSDAVAANPPDVTSVDDAPIDPELVKALGELDDRQREVVVLRFVADLPLKDVAKIVGKRVGAVKMLQARGLAVLELALQETSE
jgi:RNA polymerase sigma factor (sigma-70 family)